MSEITSTKPYMIRAIHEWCVDNGMTPHLLVAVNDATRVPSAYVKNGEIVLNLNYTAVKDLCIGNDAVTFAARFNGVSMDLYVPVDAVRGIFARENGQGMFFDVPPKVSASAEEETHGNPRKSKPEEAGGAPTPEKPPRKPTLTIVK